MRVLVSNDDGYQAPGILALKDALSVCADVTVVAPDRNRSAASNALTVTQPLRAHQVAPGHYSVEGTPTDCVHLAINGLFDEPFDRVVTGINNGPNMGDDVIYSGTVAAAIEGRFLGAPAIALSMSQWGAEHYETAAQVAVDLLSRIEQHALPDDTILNVNVPDRHYDDLNGYQVTRLGRRHQSEPVMQQHDPRGNPVYWIGPPGDIADEGEGTDFYAVEQGYVSVTPLQIDLTRYDMMSQLSAWLGQ